MKTYRISTVVGEGRNCNYRELAFSRGRRVRGHYCVPEMVAKTMQGCTRSVANQSSIINRLMVWQKATGMLRSKQL